MLISHSPLISGGAEKCLLEYTIALKSKGHDCNVVIPAKGELSRELTKNNIKSSIAQYSWATKPNRPIMGDVSYIENAGKSIANIFKVARTFKPDVIITNTLVIPWGAYVARAMGVPNALLVHETIIDKQDVLDMEPSYEGYIDTINKNVDYIIYNSEHTKDSYKELITTPVVSKEILYPVPELGTLFKDKYKKNTIGDVLKIAIIGSIHVKKNQLEALQAATSLIKRGVSKFVINLYGDSDPLYVNKVKKYILSNSLQDNVFIKGYTDDVYSVINDHNVILSPFLSESFGRAVVEGQLFGRVVIANDTGASIDLVSHEKNGLIYSSGDPADLANKIEWVINNKDKAIGMGLYARKEQSRRYLGATKYKPLFESIAYLASDKHKNSVRINTNLYDPVLSLSYYSIGLEHRYRHIHRLIFNKYSRKFVHVLRKVVKPIYNKVSKR